MIMSTCIRCPVARHRLGSLAIRLSLALVVCLGCSEKTVAPESTQQSPTSPTGRWAGTVTYRDPSVAAGAPQSGTLSINFTTLTATGTNYCSNAGTVRIASSTTISVSWPQCGNESVTYSIGNNSLTASGTQIATFGGRTIQTSWQLSYLGT